MNRSRSLAPLIATAFLAFAGTGTAAAANPCGTAATPPATYDHVVWVVMENKPYSSIIGSANAPYINQLKSQCSSASQFFAETHPSLPNYIAMSNCLLSNSGNYAVRHNPAAYYTTIRTACAARDVPL